MVKYMPRNMCLFFVSVNHLIVLLNEFVEKLPVSGKVVVISDYDSEQLFLRWSHIASVDMLKTLKKVVKSWLRVLTLPQKM